MTIQINESKFNKVKFYIYKFLNIKSKIFYDEDCQEQAYGYTNYIEGLFLKDKTLLIIKSGVKKI